MKLGVKSLAIGATVALMSFGISWVASALNLATLAHITYWQGWWLQTFVPCLNIGTPAKPLCEGTPLNIAVFFLGLPFSIALYSLVALGVLAGLKRRGA